MQEIQISMQEIQISMREIQGKSKKRSKTSLDNYWQLSWAISRKNNTPKPAGNTPGPCTSSAVIPHKMSSQAQNVMNSFTNCNVTFNLNNKTSPTIRPCKRRLRFIESDSDTDWTIPWTV